MLTKQHEDMDANDDIFLGLLECADESILELNPILKKYGFQFIGYDYEKFVEHRLSYLGVGDSSQYSDKPPNFHVIINDKKVKRNPQVIQLLKNLGVTVDFDRTSWRDKIYFLEKPGKRQVKIEEVGFVSEFQVVSFRLQQILSIYTNYPLRINLISYQAGYYGWRFQYPELSKFKYPNKRIFDNRNTSSNKLTEDKHFIKQIE